MPRRCSVHLGQESVPFAAPKATVWPIAANEVCMGSLLFLISPLDTGCLRVPLQGRDTMMMAFNWGLCTVPEVQFIILMVVSMVAPRAAGPGLGF